MTQQQQPQDSSTELATYAGFEQEMRSDDRDWIAMLPGTVSREKFAACAIAAVKQNPKLLTATKRSLFNAITRAAQDGMLPDGREGFINVYNTEVKINGKSVWQPTAQWMPMVQGIRKRARELDGILIDAQVVYLQDKFVWRQGDDPFIGHEPAPLGTDRGQKIGAYAIYKRENGTILHREVMDFGLIEKVRAKSKSPDGMMWKDFPEEAWRKTVARRGMKSVPISEGLQAIINRDDADNFEFPEDAAAHHDEVMPPRPQRSDFARQQPEQVTHNPGQTLDVPLTRQAELVPVEEGQQQPRQEERREGVVTEKKGGAVIGGAIIQPADRSVLTEIDPREQERVDFVKDAFGELEGLSTVKDIIEAVEAAENGGFMTDTEMKNFVAVADGKKAALVEKAKAERAARKGK